jgi:hypothetical protein
MTNKSMEMKFDDSEFQIGEVCIANISPRERQIRLRFGIIQLVIGLVILAVLIVLEVNPIWRLPLLFIFGAAASGYFQAKDKT